MLKIYPLVTFIDGFNVSSIQRAKNEFFVNKVKQNSHLEYMSLVCLFLFVMFMLCYLSYSYEGLKMNLNCRKS